MQESCSKHGASEARQAEGKRREEAVGNWGIGVPIVHGA